MALSLVGYLPLVLILGGFFAWLHFRHLWKGERPVQDKLLRGPGESLRAKQDALSERLITPIMVITFAGMVLGYLNSKFAPLPGPSKAQVLCVVWSAALAVMVLAGWRLIHVIRKYKDYQLGFSGERAVGEELNKLMFDGCYVFHDFPAGEKWNIDHVVIAPSGIYAIETKASRKKKKRASEYYKVTFNGAALQYPHRN